MHLAPHPSLVEQVYDAIVGEIADGTFPPNTRLVQEVLAERYGVSRQPIQQALLLLKSDAIVQYAGRRGLVVAPLDMQIVRDRYQVRASLDALAARLAARRCAASPEIAAQIRRQGEYILQAGFAAVSAGASWARCCANRSQTASGSSTVKSWWRSPPAPPATPNLSF